MLIRNLKVSRLLSFGPEGIDLAMRPLNVLIGANGCGKSNFIEVLNLLRYAPVRFDSPIMTGAESGSGCGRVVISISISTPALMRRS